MLGETKNQFSLTRAGLSTGERAKSKFLSLRGSMATGVRAVKGKVRSRLENWAGGFGIKAGQREHA
jgi:hypothetical protein